MKRAVLILITLLIATNIHAGLLEVDRVWNEGDFAYALVTYTNNTNKTYGTGVTIKCIAIGSNGKKINSNTRSFFAFEHGPIKPGFSDTLKVPVSLNGLSMKTVRCTALERM